MTDVQFAGILLLAPVGALFILLLVRKNNALLAGCWMFFVMFAANVLALVAR